MTDKKRKSQDTASIFAEINNGRFLQAVATSKTSEKKYPDRWLQNEYPKASEMA
jgi:hypothetical protein